jgi:hypothetical protein
MRAPTDPQGLLAHVSQPHNSVEEPTQETPPSPPFNLPFDILCKIFFEYGRLKKGAANRRGISKSVDAVMQDLVICGINQRQLNLPELGFYSVRQIKNFFKGKICQIKHVSFLFQNEGGTHFARKIALWSQFTAEKKLRDPDPCSPRISASDLNHGENANLFPKKEQTLFTEFLKSLRGVESFCFNQALVSNINCKKNLILPESKEISLTSGPFFDFCKNNPTLKKLHLENLNTKQTVVTQAFTHFTSLQLLHFPRYHDISVQKLLSLPNLRTIRELTYSLDSLEDIESLQHYKNLEKADLEFTNQFIHSRSVLGLTDQLLTNLRNSQIKELTITGRSRLEEYFTSHDVQMIPVLPPALKKLVLKCDIVKLQSLLALAAKSLALRELELIYCTLICDPEQDFQAFRQCQHLTDLKFIQCRYRGKCDHHVAKFRDIHPGIKILYMPSIPQRRFDQDLKQLSAEENEQQEQLVRFT